MDRARLRRVWRRTVGLSGPVAAETVVRTAMRTTDVFVVALFSPAAVVAVGLGDLYARFPLRVGLGLGGGAIALSSQDTGADAATTRDEAITQALLIGLLAGIPIAVDGLLFGEAAIRVFGASNEVVTVGATYVAVVLATAPARHVTLIGARSLQGTGDTRTPMYINAVANLVNIAGSVTLGLGLFGAPRLEVLGVGLATAGANVLTAGLFLSAIAADRTAPSFVRPRDPVIAKQLLRVAVPRAIEGFASEAAQFPFNALLLSFPAGEAITAGFQIGRRLYQQATAPVSRGFSVAASILVGQSLGSGDTDAARYEGRAVTALGVILVGAAGLLLAALSRPAVGLFTDDPETVRFAVAFVRLYALSGVALATFGTMSGSLRGASETRIPFLARTTGMFGLFLGASWLLGSVLGFGPLGVYAGIGAAYVWMALAVLWGFERTGWAGRAATMMAERGTETASDD